LIVIQKGVPELAPLRKEEKSPKKRGQINNPEETFF
jgi:hypothetical protein